MDTGYDFRFNEDILRGNNTLSKQDKLMVCPSLCGDRKLKTR